VKGGLQQLVTRMPQSASASVIDSKLLACEGIKEMTMRLGCVWLLALLPVTANALKYVDLSEDDPALPSAERLVRAEARLDRLTGRLDQLHEDSDAITRLINDEGKPLQTALDGKVGQVLESMATATIQSALGKNDGHGLSWHCERAQQVSARLGGLGASAVQAATDYARAFKGAGIAAEGAAAALEAAIDDLQAALESALEAARPEVLRPQLSEIKEHFASVYGAYSTLRLVAGEAEQGARSLTAFAARLDAAGSAMAPRVREAVAERDKLRSVLATLDRGQLPPEKLQHLEIQQARVTRLHIGAIRQVPDNSIVEATQYWRDQFRAAAKKASDEAYGAWAPLREAAKPCGDHENPPLAFEQARAKAAGELGRATTALDSTGRDRAAALEAERQALAQALATWKTVADQSMDKASQVWRQLDPMDPASPQRVKLYDQHRRLMTRRKEAQAALEQIPLAQQAVQSEQEVLKRRLPGVSALIRKLKSVLTQES